MKVRELIIALLGENIDLNAEVLTEVNGDMTCDTANAERVYVEGDLVIISSWDGE